MKFDVEEEMKFDDIKPLPVICRQSCISCAYGCKRKWFLRYRLGVELRGTLIKEGAELGKIYHKFQEVGPSRKKEVLSWVREKQNALMARVDHGDDVDGNLVRLANLLTDLYHRAEAMAEIFWERYPQPEYLETITTEKQHSVKLPEFGVTIGGTVDKILRDTRNGDFWIRDHKSTGRSLDAVFGGVGWSLQARIYRLLVEDLVHIDQNKTMTVKGFILDGILKPGIKLCKKDQKVADEEHIPVEQAYLRRVKAWYDEKQDDAIRSRGMIYTEPRIPAELEEAFLFMREREAAPIDPVYHSRDITRRECFAYEKQCVYHDLCERDPKQWGDLFKTKYKFADREAS